MNKRSFGSAVAFLSLAGLSQARSLYVSSNDNDKVLKYNVFTGVPAVPLEFTPLSKASTDMAYGPDGNLYVSSSGTNNVLRYNAFSGAFLGVCTSGGNLDEPKGLRFGPDGNLYVVNSGKGRLIDSTVSLEHLLMYSCPAGAVV